MEKERKKKVVNLISNDVQRFEDGGPFGHFIWLGPLEGIVILGILCNGVLFLFDSSMINYEFEFDYIFLIFFQFRDQRIRILSDMFNGVQVLSYMLGKTI